MDKTPVFTGNVYVIESRLKNRVGF